MFDGGLSLSVLRVAYVAVCYCTGIFANSCFALKVYNSFFLFGCRVYVRYHWGLVSSFVNKRASYRVNIYSKILIVVT